MTDTPPPPGPARPRLCCLLVPDLPVAAVLRAHPELSGAPLAIAAGTDSRAELVAVSAEAAAAGVRPFVTVARARSVCATLQVRAASPALERSARAALLDVALSAGPRAELAPPLAGLRAAEAAAFLDAAGSASLFRSEAGVVAALAARARRTGLAARVALAGTRATARVAARFLALRGAEEDTHVIAAGGDAAFLAPLPIDLLDPDDALADRLSRFGVRRVADLLRLPARGLATRLGPEALRLVARARGAERAPPPAAPQTRRLEEAQDLEVPVDRLEPLAFVLRGLLARLSERLAGRGLACGELTLGLELEGGAREARRIGVAAPSLDVRVLLRLVCLALESRPLAAAVESITLATEAREIAPDQLDLFRPAGPPPAQLARALAELEALCGPGRVGSPRVPDTHRPDAWTLAPFATGADRVAEGPEPPPPSPPPAVRALRPALPARVRTSAGGRPAFLESALARGPVRSAAGPWRTSGAWWSPEERYAFDHWDVATEDGLVVRLRLDRLRRCWEIDGVYD